MFRIRGIMVKKEKKEMKEAREKRKLEIKAKLEKRKAERKVKLEKKRENNSKKPKNKKKIENPNAVIKKHHVWGLAGLITGIIIALLIITLFSVKFVTHQKSESYVEGGRDALKEVFNSVNSQGGLILNFEGESIIIAKYNKETNSVETEDSA